MSHSPRYLVRCAGCGYNFETARSGRLTCPYCRAQVWLEPAAHPDLAPLEPDGPHEPPEPPEPTPAPSRADEPHEFPDPPDRPADRNRPPPAGESPAGPDAVEGERLRRLVEAAVQLSRSGASAVVPAWESGRGSLPRRFAITIRQVLGGAQRFFSGLATDRYGRALSFAWIVITWAVAFYCLYSLWNLQAHRQEILDQLRSLAGAQAAAVEPERLVDLFHDLLVFALVLAPLVGFSILWLIAALNHLGLRLATGGRRPFVATFRATAYALAPLLLVAVPLFGSLIAMLWTPVLQVIAIGRVHRIELGRAALAVLLPQLLLAVSAALLLAS